MPKVEVMTLDSLFLHPGFIGYDKPNLVTPMGRPKRLQRKQVK
jgi:hypothetical protein